MITRILLLLACAALPAAAVRADEVRDVPIGEPVERHLSDYQPFGQWTHDPGALEETLGDRLETREVAGEELETVKLTGLVPPIRFESGVADIPAGYVRKLELGPMGAGLKTFAWDGAAEDGRGAKDGAYTFKVDATLNVRAYHWFLPLGFERSEQLASVFDVELRMQAVMDKFFARHPTTIHHRATDSS